MNRKKLLVSLLCLTFLCACSSGGNGAELPGLDDGGDQTVTKDDELAFRTTRSAKAINEVVAGVFSRSCDSVRTSDSPLAVVQTRPGVTTIVGGLRVNRLYSLMVVGANSTGPVASNCLNVKIERDESKRSTFRVPLNGFGSNVLGEFTTYDRLDITEGVSDDLDTALDAMEKLANGPASFIVDMLVEVAKKNDSELAVKILQSESIRTRLEEKIQSGFVNKLDGVVSERTEDVFKRIALAGANTNRALESLTLIGSLQVDHPSSNGRAKTVRTAKSMVFEEGTIVQPKMVKSANGNMVQAIEPVRDDEGNQVYDEAGDPVSRKVYETVCADDRILNGEDNMAFSDCLVTTGVDLCPASVETEEECERYYPVVRTSSTPQSGKLDIDAHSIPVNFEPVLEHIFRNVFLANVKPGQTIDSLGQYLETVVDCRKFAERTLSDSLPDIAQEFTTEFCNVAIGAIGDEIENRIIKTVEYTDLHFAKGNVYNFGRALGQWYEEVPGFETSTEVESPTLLSGEFDATWTGPDGELKLQSSSVYRNDKPIDSEGIAGAMYKTIRAELTKKNATNTKN